MRKHFMHLKEAPFRQIWDGHKTIELRLYDEKRQLLQPGDWIEFDEMSVENRKIVVEITAMHRFASFARLYDALPLHKCGYMPGESAHHTDMLAYYSAEEQEKYGVVGIGFVVKERKGGVNEA